MASRFESDQFTEATRNELWENPNELWNFVRKDGVVKKYIDGEIQNTNGIMCIGAYVPYSTPTLNYNNFTGRSIASIF